MPSEREKKFRDYCVRLEQVIGPGRPLQPSKGRTGGSGVLNGETVNISLSGSKENHRLDAEWNLEYIESESNEFPKVASEYRWVLDEAMKQYKSFIV
jgi:hypothetical protein